MLASFIECHQNIISSTIISRFVIDMKLVNRTTEAWRKSADARSAASAKPHAGMLIFQALVWMT
jgi:hypothetical protein